ncbi:MAG: hydrolase [Pseudonocardiales bacterium]|nr:MAG: hydrolase [Pseudonocardiales bacterium]
MRAVVFDIGGVLEVNPPTGWPERWEARLGLAPGEAARRLQEVAAAGAVGAISEAVAEQRIGAAFGLDTAQLADLMGDLWAEYVGELNTELAAYFAGLRPRCRTAILSNSFVGAREREHRLYGFGDMCDHVIYSHEEGMEKPDPRIFALTCERLGVQPAEMILLDDHPPNTEAAAELGIRAVLFRDTPQAVADIEACLAGRAR